MRLIAEGLAARRGEDLLFSDVSFAVEAGEALILTGPNGSGKSTLLRVLAGLLHPEAGSLAIADAGPLDGARSAEASHYLGHRNAMKAELSVAENLLFWKRFLGGEGLGVEEAAEEVGLGGICHLPFGYLSAGQQRRMAFAKLLVGYRPIWILDEPTAALDERAEGIFVSLINRHLRAGGLVIAATHQPLDLHPRRELAMKGFAPLLEDLL